MKHNLTRNLTYIFSYIIIMVIFMLPSYSAQAEATIDIESESAILVDAETGKVLYAKNPDVALPPASMTKMMTEYLVLEAIKSGEINWDTTTQISDYAFEVSGNIDVSGIGLRQNVDYTVKSLYEAMAINSDNGTSIALAELIAKTEGEFVKLMNEKGEEMGLPDFKFVNSTGLENTDLGENYPEGTEPDGVNLLSAKSSALLAYRLVNDYPEALEISKIPATEFDGRIIDNWNRMLPHEGDNFKQWYYEGIDGLKTGRTDLAGFCFTGTAEINGRRLISVVMKADSKDQRFKETAKLMDYGYDNFETKELFPAGYQLEDESEIPVVKGKEKIVEVETAEAFRFPIKQGDEDKYTVKYHIDEDMLNESGELVAPLEKGEKIGTAEIEFDGTDYGYITDDLNKHTVDLVTVHSVDQSNWFMLTLEAIGDFFSNLFSTIVDTIKGWF